MDRGLKAPLSPNEERTLQRVAQGTKTQEMMARDVARLHQLALVEWQRESLVITPLGRQRLGMLSPKPAKPALTYNADDVLPPERAAAQAKREADFLKMLSGTLLDEKKTTHL
jgi:hypothetical protein